MPLEVYQTVNPVIVEAIQYINNEQEIADILGDRGQVHEQTIHTELTLQTEPLRYFTVKTDIGIVICYPGDWVIRYTKPDNTQEFQVRSSWVFTQNYAPLV